MIGAAFAFAIAAIATPQGHVVQRDTAGESLAVYLMTVGPGDAIYTRYGHNAVWIRDTVARRDLVYNFGTFDPGNDVLGFIWRFTKGRPRYWLGVSNLAEALNEYRFERRRVEVQELDLLPAQRLDIAHRLANDSLPANKYYLYDYFRDNCSTRVRDVLDSILGGALSRATVDHPAEGSYRFHTMRSINNSKWLLLGIDVAFGPRADRPIDQWQEMFLPQKLHDRIAELSIHRSDGSTSPLVHASFPLLTIDRFQVDPAPPEWRALLWIAGVLLALLIAITGRSSSRRWRGLGSVLMAAWLLCTGLAGVLLLFFWLDTDHVFTYANHNLLVLSPLALLLVPAAWNETRAGRWRTWIARLLLVSCGVAVLLAVIPVVGRQDGSIFRFAVLPTVTVAWIVLTRIPTGNRGPDVAIPRNLPEFLS